MVDLAKKQVSLRYYSSLFNFVFNFVSFLSKVLFRTCSYYYSVLNMHNFCAIEFQSCIKEGFLLKQTGSFQVSCTVLKMQKNERCCCSMIFTIWDFVHMSQINLWRDTWIYHWQSFFFLIFRECYGFFWSHHLKILSKKQHFPKPY